jgi:hypothetical protein
MKRGTTPVAIKAQSSGHPFASKTNGHEELQSWVNRRGLALHQAVGTDGLFPTRTKENPRGCDQREIHLLHNERIAPVGN